MKRLALLGSLALLVFTISWTQAADSDSLRVLEPGKVPADSRLGKAKTLNDYFPWIPPHTKQAWETRKRELREQVLVANGLWPMPPKTPLKPVSRGKIEWDDYTLENVYFASYPGHYVTGTLYRPRGKSGKLPGVLCPHGHWANGRFYENRARAAHEQVKQGAEQTYAGALYPLQARCVQLARMGCVVFHYDMVGNADSQQIPHREGFRDVEAELRLQSFMGLQTYNSIRALDYLLSLPDVDAKRIGVTGASGGGTQTFILCAVDDRPAAAFPAVMVSTAMQGGCVCENCSYLRQNTGNIELAALFAPKPLAMSGARDWTIDIETKGLPELKALYSLYGAEDRVLAKCFPQFGHNYNQVSREVMYNWFNKHLQLGLPVPVVERPFVGIPPRDLTIFDAQRQPPKDAVGAEQLRKTMTGISDKQMGALRPKDGATLQEYRRVVGTALRVFINDKLPAPTEVASKVVGREERDQAHLQKLLLGRKGEGEQIPAVLLSPPEANGNLVIWIHPEGKQSLLQAGKLAPAARQLLESKTSILAPDVFFTGEFGTSPLPAVDQRYAGYTFGYNRPLVANRVHDILTAVAYARGQRDVKAVDLVGFEKAGPWVVLARGLCGNAVARTAADLNAFRFDKVQSTSDEMMLPGAVKYGGLPAFAALCAPGQLFLYNSGDAAAAKLPRSAYQAAAAGDNLQQADGKIAPEKVVEWLLR